jgi:DNA mismatch endonuclease (patch repair protein)
VHGCFWHGHDDPACPDRRPIKSNIGYWGPKLTRNKERDAAHLENLSAAGWKWLIIWECETRKLDALRKRVRSFLDD